MAKKEKQKLRVKALMHGCEVSGYVVEILTNRSMSYVIYRNMTNLITDFPLTHYVISVNGALKEEEIISLTLLW